MTYRICAIAPFCPTIPLLLAMSLALSAQTPRVVSVDEKRLGEYAGAYQSGPDAFLYLQLWSEFTGKNELVEFDESGDVRTLYPTDRDQFLAGPGAAVPTPIESRIEFQRDGTGKIVSLTWRRRDGAVPQVNGRRWADSRDHKP